MNPLAHVGMLRTVLVIYALIGCSSGNPAPVIPHNHAINAPLERQGPIDSGPSTASVAPAAGVIVLGPGTVKRAGIISAPLTTLTRALPLQLVGVLVTDPSRITVVAAPVSGRFSLDDVAGARWPAYGEWVAKGTVLGQISDARPFIAPGSGIVTHVGAQPGAIVQAGQQLLELTDFSELLARIAWTGGEDLPPTAPSTVAIVRLGAERSGDVRRTAILLGPAPEADSVTHAPAYLYRVVRPWTGARPGTPIAMYFADSRHVAQGAIVPTAAVVQWQGIAWVYVEQAPGRYIRQRIDTRHRVSTGWLVSSQGDDMSAVHAGDRIVVHGAELLLSEEFRSRVTIGEDEDKR